MGIYEELGVKKLINATGIVTTVGGSIVDSQVLEAMVDASRSFVRLVDLHRAVAGRIAELLHVPGVCVSSGAAGGTALAAAACLAGSDQKKIWQLPDTTGMKNEFICQKSEEPNYCYQAMRMVGGKLVQVGTTEDWTAADIKGALSDKTAAINYYWGEDMTPPFKEVVAIARKAGVPIIVDAAAQAVPKRNLWEIHQAGGDLVIFSGGKQLFGPQPTGLVVGRKDLVEACLLNGNPYSSVGRSMKVGKEELVGIWKAVELYMARDEEAWLAKCQRQAEYMAKELQGIPNLEAKCLAEPAANTQGIVPRTFVALGKGLGLTPAELLKKMAEGEPSIVSRPWRKEGKEGIRLDPTCLAEGEEKIVAKKVRQIVTGKA